MKQPAVKPAHPPAKQDTATKHENDALDEALKESFPSSDPIAVSVTRDAPPKR
ncbi:MAG: hypothetical protein ABW069_10270 [Duganella sp.]